MVLRSVAQMCTDAGAQTNVEEAVMGSTQHRIDIHAAWAERSILIDVVGTAAESASTRVSSAVEAGFAAQKAKIRKETNAFYQLAASRLGDGAIIMSFAFERQGRLGKKALGLIEFCVGKRVHASLDITDSIQSVRVRTVREISLTIQRGNVHIINCAMRMARRAQGLRRIQELRIEAGGSPPAVPQTGLQNEQGPVARDPIAN
eukprot:g30892.t1